MNRAPLRQLVWHLSRRRAIASAMVSHRSDCRIACDSLVALGNATADGVVLFAKNSNRSANECQPLIQTPRQVHAPDARLRCTYIEIPQVAETARLIGSRPFWCWGFEHGLNEHGVAIGNHTVFSKDPLKGKGLIGMDVVRLGLERARSAEQAVEVMTALIEHYGQGGSGYHDKDYPYHNSFLVADRERAFVLETSDRYWALRQVDEVGSVSNHLTIGSNWDALSDGAIEHAITQGWWSEERDERFNFADTYRDTRVLPEAFSSARHQRTCTLLEQHKGTIRVASLRAMLRDHYGLSTPPRNCSLADPESFSLCMHAAPLGTTTASMIARIPPDPSEPLTYWASLGSPCVSTFIPLYLDADVPTVLSVGGEQPSADSPWWQFKQLLTQVERDWERYAPLVRKELDAFEAKTAERMHTAQITSKGTAERTAFMHATVNDLLTQLRGLNARLS